MSINPSARFPTTTWGMVRAAKDPDSPEHLSAINRFASGYWRPVFYFIRARGYPLHAAEDLTQEFFLQFIKRDWIRRADPTRGRFRTFLLAILQRFLADKGPKRAPKQVVFDGRLVAISTLVGDDERQFQPSHTETPEHVFMRQWARAVLGNAQNRLRAWCHDEGRPDWYEIFSGTHCPAPGGARVTQQSLARQAGVTREQVRYALERTNEQFLVFLRDEVGGQVESARDIDDEIDDLKRWL